MPLDGVLAANYCDVYRNSYGESKLEFSWLQEQTPATAMAILSKPIIAAAFKPWDDNPPRTTT